MYGRAECSLIALPTRACIDLCEDKPRLNHALAERGFGAHVPAMQGPFAFPYIVKKRRAEWGEHSHVVASSDDERHYASELADPTYFTQAFVPGRTRFATADSIAPEPLAANASTGLAVAKTAGRRPSTRS